MRGLVLAGGGSRGSWESGVLKYMGELSEFSTSGFGFGSGTSVGAINISGIAMFSPSDFAEATVFVEQMWRTKLQKTSDIWGLRPPLGIPALWNPSVGTAKAESNLLNSVIDLDAIQTSGMKVRYASVDMQSGDLIIHTQDALKEYGIKPILASSSYPLAFPPVEIGSTWLSDGGLRDTAPLGAAIKEGADDIVILTTRDPYTMDKKSRSEMGNVFNFGLRCLSIQTHEILHGDIKACTTHNHWARLPEVLKAKGVSAETIDEIMSEMKPKKKVKLRVLYPTKHLGPSLDFSGDMMKRQIDQGYEDAREQLG